MNSIDDEVYVGSTTQTLAQRMGKHRQNATLRNTKLYQHMNDVGMNNFYSELICPYPWDNIEELHSKGGECIRRMGTLNQVVSGRTPRKKDKIREHKQQYREQKTDRIREHKQQYREETKTK